MTNYQQLAAELATTLAKYRPAVTIKATTSGPRVKRGEWYKSRRARFYSQGLTARGTVRLSHGEKYGNINVKVLIPALAALLGIREDAARCRYYRGKIPAEIVVQAKETIK